MGRQTPALRLAVRVGGLRDDVVILAGAQSPALLAVPSDRYVYDGVLCSSPGPKPRRCSPGVANEPRPIPVVILAEAGAPALSAGSGNRCHWSAL